MLRKAFLGAALAVAACTAVAFAAAPAAGFGAALQTGFNNAAWGAGYMLDAGGAAIEFGGEQLVLATS